MDTQVEKTLYGTRITLTFDGPEARGSLVLEESGYGIYVIAPHISDQPVVMLDLFPNSPAAEEWRNDPEVGYGDCYFQVAIHSPARDEAHKVLRFSTDRVWETRP